MDISMPVMDGFTAIREIRNWEKEMRIKASKIVALTGLGSASSKQEAFASGTNLFLTKPVKLAEVRRLMGEVEVEVEQERERERQSNRW
jgi:CheY-like chemotaxis protein